MKQPFVLTACVSAAILASACSEEPIIEPVGPLPPPLNGTAFIDPDVLTVQGPNALTGLMPLGIGSRVMYDGRIGAEATYDTWLFEASFIPSLLLEIRVNAEFDSISAVDLADLYAERFGVLPQVLREGVETLSVHGGLESIVGLNRDLVVHADQGEAHRIQGFLEEVMAHETVHISLDAEHSSSPNWKAAQASDFRFISSVADASPDTEDLAESFGAWLAVRWAGDGITDFLRASIETAIPARLQYLDDQNFEMYLVVD